MTSLENGSLLLGGVSVMSTIVTLAHRNSPDGQHALGSELQRCPIAPVLEEQGGLRVCHGGEAPWHCSLDLSFAQGETGGQTPEDISRPR